MAKIQIGKTTGPRSIKDQIVDAGVEFTRDDDGNSVLVVKFPGVDSMEFSRESLARVVETLDAWMPGDDPGSVFARTATEDPDGSLTAKFSDAKRSRSVTFSREDRADVAILLESWADQWIEFEARLNAVESDEESDGE